MKKIVALGLMASIASAPTSASTFGIDLRGHVPVSCHVTGNSAVIDVADAIADLGAVREFCNSAAGYDLFLDYAPQLAGAVVMIDGNAVELGTEGTASIAAEAGPAVRSRDVQIDLSQVEDTSDLTISFRIVPR